MKNSSSPQSGVALLMSLGILALLSILGIAYSTNMRLMERTSRDFVLEVQARYLAEAGIEYAIAELKDDARNNFVFSGVDTDDKIEPPSNSLPTNTAVTVKIIDTARQIDINNANANLLATLPGIGSTLASNIITQRMAMPNANYLTKQSIAITSGIGKTTYNSIRDYITTDTYSDPNVQDNAGNTQKRSAININTVSNDNNKLLENILAVVTAVGNATAGTVAATLINNRPIGSWQEFDTIVDNLSISNNAKDNIKAVFNPNRQKPDNNVPTEFCFHSGGTYEITATSIISRNTKTIAQKTIKATIQIFDLWNQSTTQEFWGEDINWNGSLDQGEDTDNNGTLDKPSYTDIKVTGLDNCPVRSVDDWNGTGYYTITGSLKIGYWDEFNHTNLAPWVEKKTLSDELTTFNNVADMPQWGEIILGEGDPNWSFADCSITILAMERRDPANGGDYSPNGAYNDVDETGWLYFRYVASGNEDYCTQVYYAREFDWWYNWIRDITPPRSPFMYTIEPLVNNEWEPGDGESGWGEATQFYPVKIYRAIQNGDYLELYMGSGSDTTQLGNPVIYGTYNNRLSSGWIKLRTGTWKPGNLSGDVDTYGGTHWDKLRIISHEGYYTSTSSDQAYKPLNLPNPVEWGMVWGTVTRPDSINNPADVDVEIEEPFNNNYYVNFTNGVAIGLSNSSSIQYRLKFYSNYSNTNKYLETPVLEDIWITYLPKTNILYWKEK